MHYYATFTAQGDPTGFYSEDIFPMREDGGRNTKIPADAVEITAAQRTELLSNPGTRRYVLGKVVSYTPPAEVPAVPQISKAQALLWLLSVGKTDADVEAAIASIPNEQDRAIAEIEWRYRPRFHYDHPLFAALAPAIGIPVDALPSAFRAAAAM